MRMRRSGGLVLAVPFLIGCGGTAVTTVQTLPTGRAVVFGTDRFYRSTTYSDTADTATVAIGGRTVVVKPTGIVVDGVPAVPVAEAAKSVEVSEKAGRLLVRADGRTIYDVPF